MSGKEGITNESDRNLVQGFSAESKFSNWQRLFTRSTITVKVTRLLVCLPITPLLILLLRNHGFWIAEQPITLHLIHNFSHTLHHHLFLFISNVNLPTGSTAPISSTDTIKFNDKNHCSLCSFF